jgi:hypothetical protein
MAEPSTTLDRYTWDAAVHCWYCADCGSLVRDREPHDRLHRRLDALDYGDGR